MNLKFWKKKIVVRIAPSPTGNLHMGTARAALFNYLYAKQNGGKFIIRIEDTDKERSRKEFENNIIEGLKWLGIEADEFYRQSERGEFYKKHIEKMLKNGTAYVSKEEETLDEVRSGKTEKRSEVIRFKNPNKKIKFNDVIRGEIEFDTTELKDFVIAKSIDEPLYHLAVVVDDFEMGITHVIRGEDGISNTPRQILIQEAIGAPRPEYAHLPLILNQNKSKLSKRDGAASLDDFKEKGYLKDAIINFLAFLGWAPSDDREIFSMKELIKEFDLSKVQKSGAIFNIEKLDWFNKEYIKIMPDEEILKRAQSSINKDQEDVIKRALPEIKERITKLEELNTVFNKGEEFDYLLEIGELDLSKINWKDNTPEQSRGYLERVLEELEKISENDFKSDKIKGSLWDFASEKGRGDVLWPYRYALSGKDKSIDPFNLSYILGKEETIKRLKNAIQKIYK